MLECSALARFLGFLSLLQEELDMNWHFPFGTRRVRLLTKTPSFNPVFAPNRVPRAVFGLAEYVMPSIWLQTAKITAC